MLANAPVAVPRRDPVAYLLLLAVGCLVALMLPLARVAIAGGLTPLSFAFWQALGGGCLLWLWAGPAGPGPSLTGTWRYFLFSGLTAIAIPNALAFVVVDHVGTGLTSTLYALPSLITYALALMVRLETVSPWRIVGLLLGVMGCVRILLPDTDGVGAEALPWLLLGLLVPVSLAVGNVYRTVAWPKGASAKRLAPGMLLSGALLVALVLIVTGEFRQLLVPGWDVASVLVVQGCVSALTYRGFFELQRRSSPVFLSQIGFVVAPVGLILAYLIFGERFGWEVWSGVAVVLAGVLLANWRA